MEFNSNIHEVVKIKKNFKARYTSGIKVGDKIKFSIKGLSERGSQSLHAPSIVLFVNGETIAEINQGEFNNFYDTFELKEDGQKLSENKKEKHPLKNDDRMRFFMNNNIFHTNPMYGFTKILIVIDRKGNDQYASVQSITKVRGSFFYTLLLEDGSVENISQEDLRVTN